MSPGTESAKSSHSSGCFASLDRPHPLRSTGVQVRSTVSALLAPTIHGLVRDGLVRVARLTPGHLDLYFALYRRRCIRWPFNIH